MIERHHIEGRPAESSQKILKKLIINTANFYIF